MSSIFRHTIYVSVLACGALLTACHSSSDNDQSGRNTASVTNAKATALKVERNQAPATSAAREPTTHHRSVASTKATHGQLAAHAKADTDTKPNAAPSLSNPFTNP